VILRCSFEGNNCDNWGGGLHGQNPASVFELANCTFSGNGAGQGSSVYVRGGSSMTVTSSIFAFGTGGQPVWNAGGSVAGMTCSDVFGNAAGDYVGAFATGCGFVYTVASDGTGDYPSQSAINGVVNGDIIELMDGTYVGAGNRDLVLSGKSLTLRSATGDSSRVARGYWSTAPRSSPTAWCSGKTQVPLAADFLRSTRPASP